jgi:hypothetical protein
MNLRTEINPRFLLRMGLVGLACVVMTGLCIKDGLYSYPAQSERAHAYLDFETAHPDVSPKELFEMWKEESAQRGWEPGHGGKPVTPYGEPKKEYQFNQQLYMGGFTGLLGLFFLAKMLLNRGRWIEVDGATLRSSEKREVGLDQITALDKKRWQNKGIANVLYEVNGRPGKIVLDDCNYNRDTTNAILRHLEESIDREKIVNGKPEPPLKANQEAAATGA